MVHVILRCRPSEDVDAWFTKHSDGKCFNVQDTCVWMDGKVCPKAHGTRRKPHWAGDRKPHPMVWCFGHTGGHGETDLISDGGADD